MSAPSADGRVGNRIENYNGFWEQDLKRESENATDKRLDSYTEVVNGYYDGATELYEYGWAQSFHFSRFYKGEAFLASLARHEHYLAAQMNLRPGMRVLDVGCGVGGPAREIAQFSDANIVGLNNNDFQIGRARKYTKKAGLEPQVTFVKGDFMKLAEQFGENSFDAVYAIEATVHAPNWEGVYGEIFKILKPGGVVSDLSLYQLRFGSLVPQFGVYEWCMTDTWDPSITSHKELAHRIEIGNGIPEMRPLRLARQALETVGFKIEHEEDLAARPDAVPWYYPLEGDISKAQTFWDYFTVWRMSWSGKLVTHNATRVMEWVGLVPKGTHSVGESLKVAGDALVEGGQTKVSLLVRWPAILGNLVEFERRSQGSIRGDAKKFALERASDFIAQFGLPPEFLGVHEADNKFREQIYNWFKNTVGRNRRKIEGRPRSGTKKSPEKVVVHENPTDIPSWNSIATTTIIPYAHAESSSSPAIANSAVTRPPVVSPVQYATLHNAAPIPIPTPIPTVPSPHIKVTITKSTIRDAFLRNVEASSLANMIQTFAISDPSPTPLTAVVEALFEALSTETKSGYFNDNREPHAYLRRYLDASLYFTPSVVHAGVSGPMAGPRAIQMHVRKFATWVPNISPMPSSSTSRSMTDDMQRIANDRQRRKDHIQWANIHSAALELGMLGMGHAGDADNSGYAYAMGRAFSEMIARDAVWESDEVEWVAGICILRAVIRTAMRGDRRQRDEYDELLRTYEKRWKEIKDEARQAFVTVSPHHTFEIMALKPP
ncbi:hypothetical protein C0991_010205 [Blastosporella zonata]|nr:hypothetical protein C0991_010205 [Blastosporella zonata]